MNRKCRTCQTIFKLNSINFHEDERGRHKYHCKSCFNKKRQERIVLNKKRCIEYKGGKCQICGYNRFYGALEFHHLDPNIKDFAISERIKSKFEDLKPELDKCVLLCCLCHREVEAGIIKLNP